MDGWMNGNNFYKYNCFTWSFVFINRTKKNQLGKKNANRRLLCCEVVLCASLENAAFVYFLI